jgi:hypothetical protein
MPRRSTTFENRNRFSLVRPPAGIVSPSSVTTGALATAQVVLQIGS